MFKRFLAAAAVLAAFGCSSTHYVYAVDNAYEGDDKVRAGWERHYAPQVKEQPLVASFHNAAARSRVWVLRNTRHPDAGNDPLAVLTAYGNDKQFQHHDAATSLGDDLAGFDLYNDGAVSVGTLYAFRNSNGEVLLALTKWQHDATVAERREAHAMMQTLRIRYAED